MRTPFQSISEEIDPQDSVSQMDSNGSGPKTRSLMGLPLPLQRLTSLAADIVEDYILFDNPLPNAEEVPVIVNDAWKQAEFDLNTSTNRLKPSEVHVYLLSAPLNMYMLTRR